tara:strand:- start:59 stop:307 length:249 start_codon:yes stop_codon:yes gene_type:complete
MICVGDIVKRKFDSECLVAGVVIAADWMFYEGYFIVLDVVTKNVNTTWGDKSVSVCLIMNDKGKSSWISTRILKIASRLNND